VSTLYQYYKEQDAASQLIFKETPHPTSSKRIALLEEAAKEDSNSRLPTDRPLSSIWITLGYLAHQLHAPDPSSEHHNPGKIPQTLAELSAELTDCFKTLKDTTPQPDLENPTACAFPRATTLINWFSFLEVLQAVTKALDSVDEHFKKNPKSLPAKAKTDALATSKKLRAATDDRHKSIKNWAQVWIEFLKKSGITVLKKWARWGETGQALMELLSEEDVHFYAKRAVDSLVDALEGVGKVKVKR
jgi:heme oxygenase